MKKDSTALRRYLDSFPARVASEMMTAIADGCKVSRFTAYNWKYGACRIPELAKDKIEEIFGEEIFDRLENAVNDADALCDE